MDGIGIRLLGVLFALTIIEGVWLGIKGKRVYNLWDSLSNVFISVVNNLTRPVTIAWKYIVFGLLEPLQFFELDLGGPLVLGRMAGNEGYGLWTFLATFVIADCAYYWYHRLSHEIPILWTMHHTHHSSPWMNLTTAVRLNWIANLISPAFFAPLILLGFSGDLVVASLAIGLFYQFFLHTETVPRLGWLEGKLLNTPSAHRVHHGSNSAYIDKNYGGAFIIWDRLFGTYQDEIEPVKYGVTTGFVGHNPFTIQLGPLWKYLAGTWKREKVIDEERRARGRQAPRGSRVRS